MDADAQLNRLRDELARAERMHRSGDDQAAWNACSHILKAMDEHALAAANGTVAGTLRADTFTLLGTLSNIHQLFEQGRVCFREAMSAYEVARGQDDLFTHVARSNLAISLQGLGWLEEAINALKSASAGMQRNLNVHTRAVSELARTLGELGAVQADAGFLPEAKTSLEDAIRYSESIGDAKTVEDCVIEANHYNSLGIILRLEGQALRSMSAIESAISMLAPLWQGSRPWVEPPMAAFIQNYDLSKRDAGVIDDALIVAKFRTLYC